MGLKAKTIDGVNTITILQENHCKIKKVWANRGKCTEFKAELPRVVSPVSLTKEVKEVKELRPPSLKT